MRHKLTMAGPGRRPVVRLAMSETTTGTDTQDNYFSITAQGMGIGEGGPAPTPYVGAVPATIQPSNPQGYDAILKICDGAGPLTLAGMTVAQGHEDSVNFTNGCHDIQFSGVVGAGTIRGLRAITIKGPCRNITFGPTVIDQHGTDEDVKLGDWLDESYGAPDRVDLSNITMQDGSKVQVVVGHSPWPKYNPSKQILFGSTAELKLYWWFKRGARILCGVKVGQQGPKNFLGFIDLT